MAPTDCDNAGGQTSRQRQCAAWLAFYLGDVTSEHKIEQAALSNARLVEIVEAGLPVTAAEWLRRRTQMSTKQFGQIIPPSTLRSKRKNANNRLSTEQSDRVMRVAEIYAHAADVFGGHEPAKQWMQRTNPRMPDGRTPEEMLATSYGARYVDDILVQVEHGITA